ncbi:MAG: histidine phosphatase family protein [Nitrospirae bacterium]|nr:histidine phosphatase family protein [Nitrospirota bacterium]
MVTTLYLIRHGETEGSEEKRYKGTIDVPLSEKGVRQIEQVSAFIAEKLNQSMMQDTGYRMQDKNNHASDIRNHESLSVAPKLDAVYCSDLRRAVKSAEIIAKAFGLIPETMEELRERNFGEWEGMSFDEIKEKYPEDFNAWVKNPLMFRPTGGESTLEVKERSIKALDRIIDNHSGGDIAIVAHGGVNRVILCQLLGVPLENIFRIEQDYAAINIIEFHSSYPVIKTINYILY